MTYSDGMNIQQCPYCGEMYTTQDTCPSCASKDAPKPKQKASNSSLTVVSAILTFSDYKKASPNKVSKEEYHRYLYLHRLAEQGVISDLQIQVSYPLVSAVTVPSIHWYNGTKKGGYKQGAISYSPDFKYIYAGVQVIEEYKAVPDKKLKPRIAPASRLRIKMWLDKYSDKIISGKWFFVISGWQRKSQRYYAFDSNGNLISYPVTNYEYMQTESEAA